MNTVIDIQATPPSESSDGDGVHAVQMILKEWRGEKYRLAQQQDASLLRHGAAFLLAAVTNAAAERYRAICRPGGNDAPPQPVSLEEIRIRLSALVAGQPRYPIVFWLVPGGAECDAAVSGWFAHPERKEPLHAALQAGGIWISVADVFLDVLSSTANAGTLLRWLRNAEPESVTPLRWWE